MRNVNENRTEWYFEFWSKSDGLPDLRYPASSPIVSYAVEMKDKNWRKNLDENLLTCVAQTVRAASNLHAGVRLRDVREGVLNGAYRVMLWAEP